MWLIITKRPRWLSKNNKLGAVFTAIIVFYGKSVFGLRLASFIFERVPINLNERSLMSKQVKIGFFIFAVALMLAPAVSQAQIATRRGTVAGAIIGGIIGDQNNEALAGVAIGGLVGNVAGRAVDRNSFRGSFNQQQPVYRSYQQPVYQQPVYQQPVYQQPVYQQPVYQQPVYQQPVYRGYGGYRGGCGY